MPSLQYINSKLSDAIYTLTIHEGDARKRLAAVLPKLNILNPNTFPSNLVKDYKWVMETIERGRSKYLRERPDYNLPNIHNSTASKVIKKILKIQDEIQVLSDKEDIKNRALKGKYDDKKPSRLSEDVYITVRK